MKTLKFTTGLIFLVLAVLIFGLIALSGCASEWKCPHAPKAVAIYSVGDRIAFNRFLTVWNERSDPHSYWIDKGDTGVVVDIVYLDQPGVFSALGSRKYVRYEVQLDKAEHLYVLAFDAIMEAVYYPDPALAPTKKE